MLGSFDNLSVTNAEAKSNVKVGGRTTSNTMSSKTGVIAPRVAKVAVGAGVFPTPVINTHYYITEQLPQL